jgi:rhodanese-related sulfurtransferase/copper chaperone CopZ
MKKLLMTLVAAALAMTGIVRAGEYPDISVADLKKAIADKKVALIDANGSDSWKEGHIPGALDLETQEAKLGELLPKDKNTLVVAYCGGPACSAYVSAAKAAEKLGYKNVKHLSAGISGWTAAGEKTEKGEKKEKGEDGKKTSTEKAEPHTYVATFTGVACSACEAKVGKAIAKLPGGANAKWEAGKEEGTKLVTFTATNCGCAQGTKEGLIAALGDDAKSFVVTEVAAK